VSPDKWEGSPVIIWKRMTELKTRSGNTARSSRRSRESACGVTIWTRPPRCGSEKETASSKWVSLLSSLRRLSIPASSSVGAFVRTGSAGEPARPRPGPALPFASPPPRSGGSAFCTALSSPSRRHLVARMRISVAFTSTPLGTRPQETPEVFENLETPDMWAGNELGEPRAGGGAPPGCPCRAVVRTGGHHQAMSGWPLRIMRDPSSA
jgi:hypothetical protein